MRLIVEFWTWHSICTPSLHPIGNGWHFVEFKRQSIWIPIGVERGTRLTLMNRDALNSLLKCLNIDWTHSPIDWRQNSSPAWTRNDSAHKETNLPSHSTWTAWSEGLNCRWFKSILTDRRTYPNFGHVMVDKTTLNSRIMRIFLQFVGRNGQDPLLSIHQSL